MRRLYICKNISYMGLQKSKHVHFIEDVLKGQKVKF